jgi:glyceraldehyde 3-phosphate dehydrogenase
VDYVLECTGKFNSKEKLLTHINNGAKRVIVSAPCKDADKTIVYGVNESELKKEDKIISAASCTTNCLAPVAHVLNENFEIEKGFMTTIHSFTSDQRILDNSHKDLRRARSASQSIVPTATGASKAIGEIIPSLRGKLEGVAMRVPTPNVSLIELVFCTKKDITIDKINLAFQNFSKKNKILETTKEKLVSIDFNHNPASSIIDESLTKVVSKNMGKISAWYDNEWGFSNRMCDIVEYLHKNS